MKERIKEFIDYKGISAGELASMLEVQRSNISHILNGRNKPGASLIEKMLMVFPDLNARWLLTGEGSISVDVNTDYSDKKPTQENNQPKKEVQNNNSNQNNRTKQINKVVLLYNDGTFDSYDK